MTRSILFVCLGNICRSPLAHGALRAEADQRDFLWRIDSASTGAWHVGQLPDPRAIAAASRGGIDISDLRARQVSPQDFHDFDLIIAMDTQNLRDLNALAPKGSKAQLSLMLDHVPELSGQSVADPYYGDDSGFDATFVQVRTACATLADAIEAAAR